MEKKNTKYWIIGLIAVIKCTLIRDKLKETSIPVFII